MVHTEALWCVVQWTSAAPTEGYQSMSGQHYVSPTGTGTTMLLLSTPRGFVIDDYLQQGSANQGSGLAFHDSIQ